MANISVIIVFSAAIILGIACIVLAVEYNRLHYAFGALFKEYLRLVMDMSHAHKVEDDQEEGE